MKSKGKSKKDKNLKTSPITNQKKIKKSLLEGKSISSLIAYGHEFSV